MLGANGSEKLNLAQILVFIGRCDAGFLVFFDDYQRLCSQAGVAPGHDLDQ